MSRGTATLSVFFYAVNVLVTTFFVCLSCVALLSQAVRTSPHRSWNHNFNAVVIGAAYAIVVSVACIVCLCSPYPETTR